MYWEVIYSLLWWLSSCISGERQRPNGEKSPIKAQRLTARYSHLSGLCVYLTLFNKEIADNEHYQWRLHLDFMDHNYQLCFAHFLMRNCDNTKGTKAHHTSDFLPFHFLMSLENSNTCMHPCYYVYQMILHKYIHLIQIRQSLSGF